ncbi:hypothetical protein JOF35_004427 [Streptomyces demainii]|uniref:Amino acid transporter n=1 Tax=Streptomyces demainii TaxID=588122 RepID=A0ABT9KUN9_9ACTN|nr:hypothetical protein [Streptomyces demainii]
MVSSTSGGGAASDGGPRDRLRAWLLESDMAKRHPGPHAEPESAHRGHPWWRVMCLTGLDYFSTLGYQPGIAALAAGLLSPLATVVLVVVTLVGALPVYRRVAHESPHGQGSIAMLERLLTFWKGKVFVLTLLGFAATDFLITITLSAADATAHLVENPHLTTALRGHEVTITWILVGLLGAVFLKGFTEAIGIAVTLVATYLVLNAVVVAVGLWHVFTAPQVIPDWSRALVAERGSPLVMVGVALVIFPKLALGLSGFETGVAVMPHIEGKPGDTEERPTGRIQGTRKLLTTAALIMSVFLITSSFITTLLIPQREFRPGGHANGRALAYLAHEYLGSAFGSVYDASTIAILWFAGGLGHGRAAQPDAPLSAALRHGTPLGACGPPHGAGVHRHRVPGDLALQGERGRPGRRLRHRCARAHHLRHHRRHHRRAARPAARLDRRLRRHLGGLPLHHRGEHHRAARRRQDRRLFHRRHPGRIAAVPGRQGVRAAGHQRDVQPPGRAVHPRHRPPQNPLHRQ